MPRAEVGIHDLKSWGRYWYRNSEKHGVQTARNGPSPPPTPAGGPVARPELSTADRLGSRERADGAAHFVAPKDDPSLKDQQAFWIDLPPSPGAIQNLSAPYL